LPATVAANGSFTLSLANVQVPGHPSATVFSHAFDCGSGVYMSTARITSVSCSAGLPGVRNVGGKVFDQDGDSVEYRATVTVTQVAQAITFASQPPNPALLRGSYAVTATGGASGNTVVLTSLTPNVCTIASGTVQLAAIGTCTIAANQTGTVVYGAAPQATQSFKVLYGFVGFAQPVDNLPALNSANAGQSIPLKWRVVDAVGAPVTNLTQAAVTTTSLTCNAGIAQAQLEEYAASGSTLQNLGDGYYQLNWKTSKSDARSCKTLHLDLGEGMTRQAAFAFK